MRCLMAIISDNGCQKRQYLLQAATNHEVYPCYHVLLFACWPQHYIPQHYIQINKIIRCGRMLPRCFFFNYFPENSINVHSGREPFFRYKDECTYFSRQTHRALELCHSCELFVANSACFKLGSRNFFVLFWAVKHQDFSVVFLNVSRRFRGKQLILLLFFRKHVLQLLLLLIPKASTWLHFWELFIATSKDCVKLQGFIHPTVGIPRWLGMGFLNHQQYLGGCFKYVLFSPRSLGK